MPPSSDHLCLGRLFRTAGPDLITQVRVIPRASRAGIDGFAIEDTALRVRMVQAPVDGAANAAVIRLLAEAWGLPKSALVITRGGRDRVKTVTVTEGATRWLSRIQAWMNESATSATEKNHA